ncbi:MAG: hypothetical protein ACTSW4_06660 [Candidatus Ranarchaeia archaeon]
MTVSNWVEATTYYKRFMEIISLDKTVKRLQGEVSTGSETLSKIDSQIYALKNKVKLWDHINIFTKSPEEKRIRELHKLYEEEKARLVLSEKMLRSRIKNMVYWHVRMDDEFVNLRLLDRLLQAKKNIVSLIRPSDVFWNEGAINKEFEEVEELLHLIHGRIPKIPVLVEALYQGLTS